ncbi:MAG TPA: PA14 domain-containing protein, partial [Humisphaera sp.]
MRSRTLLARRRAVISAAIASAVSLSGVRTGGADLSWDATSSSAPAPAGGTGTWDTSSLRWSNGTTFVGWNNAAGDNAVFGGTPGTVTIDTSGGAGTGVVVGGLTFNSAGYVIAGSAVTDLLTLAPGATLNGTGDAEVSALLAGTAGFTKAGTNTITLSGNNSGLSGPITVSGGALSVSAANNLGAAANTVTLSNNATLQVTGTFTAAQPVSLGTGGGTIAVTAANTFTLAAPLAATANALTKTGTGRLALGTGNSTRTGATTVSSGTLSATVTSAANPLGTGTINLSGGGTLDLTPVANVGTQGLSGRQFTSNAAISDTARIDFTQTAGSTRVDSAFTLTQANNLAAPVATQWLGKLNIVTGGNYTFAIGSDDGSRLWIDGNLVVQNDGAKGVANGTSAALALSSGLHDVRIDYVNSGGNGNLNLLYSGPDQTTSAQIPASRLFTAETNTTAGASNAVVIGTGIGDALNVSGPATIKLSGSAFTQAQLGNATFAAGSNLTLATDTGQNGKALRLGGTTNFATGTTTLNLAGDGTAANGANLYVDGVVGQTGGPVTINKTGSGRLFFSQTAAASGLTSASLIDVQAGSMQLVGSSATGSFNPIGAAGIRLSGAGTRLILDSKIGSTTASTTFANAIDVTENATIQDIVSGGSIVTLGGPISVAAGKTLTLDAIKGGNPVGSLGAALVVSGNITGPSSSALTLASTGIGSLAVTPVNGSFVLSGNNSGFSGSVSVASGSVLQANGTNALTGASVTLNNNTLNLFSDGNGSGQLETLAYADNVTLTGAASTIAVNRLGNTFAPLFTTAANKVAQLGTLTTNSQGLTVANTNQYQLRFAGTTTLGAGAETFTVNTATASNLNPGLAFTGQVVGTPTGITKAGAGTLLLDNNTNGFTANLVVTGGVLGATSNEALGNLANTVTLNGATAGFEAFDTFSTSRAFTFSNATNSNNLLLVAQGKTLTIDSALGGANGFQKGDPGILVLTSNTSTISGAVIASGGVLRITNANALGATSGLTVAANEGTAFQLDGGGGAFNFARPISLAGSTGIQNNGQLQNLAGANTVSGAITLAAAATIGNSDTTNALTITGGIGGAFGLTFNGTGNTNVTTTAIGAVTGLTRNGSGTTNISVANPLFVSAIGVNQGSLVLSGVGTVGTGAVATTVTSGGSFVLDNSGTTTSGRLGTTRTLNLSSGTFQLIGGSGPVTESMGALTSTWGGNTIRIDPGGGTNAITFASIAANAVNGGSTLVFQSGAGGGSSTFGSADSQVFFTTAPTAVPATSGIVPRAIVFDNTGGSPSYNFASYNHTGLAANTLGIQAFQGYNNSNNLAAALATDTLQFTSSANISANKTVNAIAGNAAGVVLNAPGLTTLAVTSGNVLVKSGDLTLGNNLIVAFGGVEGGLNVAPGATLNVNGPITSSANMTTGLGGTINFNTRQFFNTGSNALTINGGTVNLAGGDNTIFPGQGTGVANLVAVGPGATLNLNGTAQVVGGLQNPNNNPFGGAGGTVTSAAPATLVSRQPNANWGGVIGGAVTFVMGNTSTNVERFYQDNTYTGRTAILGGTLELTDSGRLSNTAGIDINYGGQLNLNNTSANNGRFDLADRVPNGTAISLRGGSIGLLGRAQTDSTETLGTVTANEGWNNIFSTAGGVGVNSATLTIGSLVRPAAGGAIVHFGTQAGGSPASGQAGSAARTLIGTAPTLSNNLIGPWAINIREFATYVPGLGVAPLNAAGAAGYNQTALTGVTLLPTDNVRVSGAAGPLTSATTLNTLN